MTELQHRTWDTYLENLADPEEDDGGQDAYRVHPPEEYTSDDESC